MYIAVSREQWRGKAHEARRARREEAGIVFDDLHPTCLLRELQLICTQEALAN